MYKDNTTVNKHPNSQQQQCLQWLLIMAHFLHAVTQELLLSALFSYFYHFGLERDGANETQRERANYGNEILSGWGCSPSVSLSSWKSLPLPCCFSWPAVLTVPALCACACMRAWRVALLSTPFPLSLNTHTRS